MSNLTSFQRKLVYIGGIVLLLVPITWLGMPAEPARSGGFQGSAGGLLAQSRDKYKYGEHDLGNVDPASSTMNLLLLGFRGFATSKLWTTAIAQQRNKDWAGLRATTESIILLQPHFLKVWHFEGWNLAYNVSAEWDGVADRYYWVKEGIKFFKKGRDRNEQYAELAWYVGDTTGKKIGRSDEATFFRKFYRSDPDTPRFNGGPDKDVNPGSRDNYQEAADWFQLGNDTIVKWGNEQHIMAPYLFRAFPQRAIIDQAMAMQREGDFGEVCRNVWQDAFLGWTEKYGKLPLDCPELGEAVTLEHTPEEMAAMRKKENEEKKDDWHRMTEWIRKYREQANYNYWRTRASSESEKDMSESHRLLYDAEQALFKADPTTALKLYQEGMAKFESVLDRFPDLKDEDETADEAISAVMGWQKALEYLDEPAPDNFPLKSIWDDKPGRRQNVKSDFERRRRGGS
ncbi:MAG: hypothetical protein JSS02_08165 [Planctomycetes bacterium]|nr:hypothetical protein [Planctomycetota bacterium]